MDYITEPAKKVPLIAKADLCVVGGSCTGVFAAIRAARLGLKVVLIEKQNMLGGTAVCGLVNIWHSLHDTEQKNQIIAGLTYEVLEKLKGNDAVRYEGNPNHAYEFNPWELTVLLDKMVREQNIHCLLHTVYAGVCREGDTLKAVFVENSDGRGAVEADFFIDATGDGRLARDLALPSYVGTHWQPPTSCFYLAGKTAGLDVGRLIEEHGAEFGLGDDWGWSTSVPGLSEIGMRADNHVFHVRCDKAEELTFAEMEGRRQAKALTDLLRKYGHPDLCYALAGLCSHIGVRETVHYRTRFMAKTMDLLTGKRYDAPILNGSYRVDIHHSEDGGITFRYLDGTQVTVYGRTNREVRENWREKEGIRGEAASFYQLPFDSLVQNQYRNFIPVGRMIHAEEGAFGALRVMVNLNQLGEAAGVAAYLCLHSQKEIFSLSGKQVTETLRAGGSAL